MRAKYTHLLFDLDHTLWDFNTNCKNTLYELYLEHEHELKSIDKELFFTTFLKINSEIWHLFDQNKISKEEMRIRRFRDLLQNFDINNDILANTLEDKYLFRCPKKGALLPYSLDFLNLVKDAFEICLITNGFHQVQLEKVKYSGLDVYFEHIFSSESTQSKKPEAKFFNHVLSHYQLDPEKTLIIGDNPYTDIQGAKNMGIHSLWINSQGYTKNIESTYYSENIQDILHLFT